MKIKNGFITNSSSTSFLISLKNEWKKESFMSAIGATGKSPMNIIFEELFESIDNQKQEIHKSMEEEGESERSVSEFLSIMGFDSETIEIIEKLMADGSTIYYGKLYSDAENSSEVYFCSRSFVISDDDIYFNGSIGGW